MSCGGGDVANQPCPHQKACLTSSSVAMARIQMSPGKDSCILRARLNMGKRRVKVSVGVVVGLPGEMTV